MKCVFQILVMSLLSAQAHAFNTSIYYEHYRSNGEKIEYRIRAGISDSFDSNDIAKLKDAFQIVADEVEEHFYSEHVRNRNSDFRKCLNKYATKDIDPSQYRNSGRNKNQRISNLMSSMVMVFGLHRQTSNRAQIGYFSESPQGDTYTMGRAPVYTSEWPNTKINITMNRKAVQNYDVRNIAGTIFHEIMHNLGWNHPTGYPGSFIKEAGLCIVRNNADKNSGFGLTGDPGYNIID